MNRMTFPFFDGYFGRQRLEEMKRRTAKFHGMVQQLAEENHFEQRARLRAIRDAHPWEAERAIAVRQQADRATQVVLRLRQYRELCDEIRQLEAQLPPRTGWHRLRYWNPWVLTWGLCAMGLVVNGVRIWLEVRGGA